MSPTARRATRDTLLSLLLVLQPVQLHISPQLPLVLCRQADSIHGGRRRATLSQRTKPFGFPFLRTAWNRVGFMALAHDHRTERIRRRTWRELVGRTSALGSSRLRKLWGQSTRSIQTEPAYILQSGRSSRPSPHSLATCSRPFATFPEPGAAESGARSTGIANRGRWTDWPGVSQRARESEAAVPRRLRLDTARHTRLA